MTSPKVENIRVLQSGTVPDQKNRTCQDAKFLMCLLRNLLFFWGFLSPGLAWGHEPLASWTTARLHLETLVLQVSLAPGMVKPFLDSQMVDAPWVDYTNFSDVHPLLLDWFMDSALQVCCAKRGWEPKDWH